jgi:hypothetical protein
VRPASQRFANITDNSNKSSKVYKDFVRAVKTNIQQKYTTDTQAVIRNISFNYRIRFKQDRGRWSNWVDRTYNGQVQGQRRGLDERATQAQLDEIQRLEESDSELDSITEVAITAETVVPMNGGKLVAKGVRVARMRATGAFQLDLNYIGDASWDRKENTCVYDYIFHKYAGKESFKKKLPADDREKTYDYLDSIFTDQFNPNPREEGISIDQLKLFCDRFDVGMIALDKNEKLITYVKNKVSKGVKTPIIFIISNNHFYPIDCKDKRASIVAKNREADKPDEEKRVWVSEDYVFAEKEKKEKGGEENQIQFLYPVDKEPTGNDYALKIITETNTLPNPKSVRLDGNTISQFQIGNTIYMTEPPEKEIVKYFGNDFVGQTVNSVLMDTWKEIQGEDFGTGDGFVDSSPITSRVNPLVHKILTDQNVKYRTHYGATREIPELYDVLKPMSVNMKYKEIQKVPYKDIFTGETKFDIIEIMKYRRVVFPPKNKYEQMIIDGEIIGIDINKCYSSCLQNPMDTWIKYDLEDTWEEFDGNISTGLYYVETDDMTLLHKTNIYSNKIIEKAIQENIPIIIRKQLKHKKKSEFDNEIAKEYFHPFINKIKADTRGTGLGKLMINMITGYLGKTTKSSRTAELDTDLEAVWRHFLACEKPEKEVEFEKYFFSEEFVENNYTRFHKDNLILQSIIEPKMAGDKTEPKKIFLYGYETKKTMNEYTLPMYLQILDWSNIKLYELGKKVGGEIIYRHTDLIVSLGGKIPIRDMTNSWGDYSVEVKNWNFKSLMKTDRAVEIKEFETSWKSNPNLKSSSDWVEIIKYAIDNGGLLIEGRAGTGKSFVPKSAFKSGILNLENKETVDEYGKTTKIYANTKTMSFTNKASRNIEGTTIHKTFHITEGGSIPKKTMNGLKFYKYFVIDEIGMINDELWKYLMLLKRENPTAIFILIGDYRQLPPVDSSRILEYDIFNHPVVKFLCNNNKIELTEKQRYDQSLWDFLERGYENGDWSGLKSREVDFEEIYQSKNICYTNKTRVDINKRCMEYFKEQEDVYVYLEFIPKQKPVVIGNKTVLIDDPKERRQSVYLYPDLPIMSWKNNTELGIVNSEEFKIVGWSDDDELIIKRLEGGAEDIIIYTEDFHNNFLANYASTAHKSQGATYIGNVIIWEWEKIIQDRRLCYTACSRATKLENLIIAK